jgi:phospholipase C
MRRVLVGLGALALSSCLLGLITANSRSLAAAPMPAAGAISPASPIKHVVILYQENHTFDDVLGTVCQAAARTTPCNGYTGPVTFADGVTAQNAVQPDQIPVVDHNPHAQHRAVHNEWDGIAGCSVAPYWCVSHVDLANMPNLTELANTFTVSDATFAAGKAASFGAHVTLGAGTFDGFRGHNPVNSKTGALPQYGWGCASQKDAVWGPRQHLTYQPTCIPDLQGRGPYRSTEVPYTATIMERMEQAGLSWHIYEGDSLTEPNLGIWSVCTYFAWCWLDRWDLQYDSSRTDFINAAESGTLPNLSILIPTGNVSQHNYTSMAGGDNYIGQMVGAVMNGPDWDSTAIFITYDDCGCFYDHVAPPSRKMGLRNPMVIISPWVAPGGTDSTVAVQPYSMLAFTDHLFGLPPLTSEVADSYDYAGSFDFAQRPLRGLAMTHTRIPPSERRRLARLLPMVEKDPT